MHAESVEKSLAAGKKPCVPQCSLAWWPRELYWRLATGGESIIVGHKITSISGWVNSGVIAERKTLKCDRRSHPRFPGCDRRSDELRSPITPEILQV